MYTLDYLHPLEPVRLVTDRSYLPVITTDPAWQFSSVLRQVDAARYLYWQLRGLLLTPVEVFGSQGGWNINARAMYLRPQHSKVPVFLYNKYR